MKSTPTWMNVMPSMSVNSASAPRYLPRMICGPVSGEESSSSMVPERFSSA